MTLVTVYLPASSSHPMIDAGSGIVGTPLEGDRVLVDYEGNRYGARNMVVWADRVSHAHGRHQDRYPTVARASLRSTDLVEVADFDTDSGDVHVHPEQVPAVLAWLGVSADELAAQCQSTSARYQMRRDLATLRANPAMRHVADQFARRHHLDG